MAQACRAEGCDTPAVAKGLCKRHWHKERRYGDAAAGASWKRGESLEWLRSHVAYVGDDCLIWPFTRSTSGYPVIVINGRQVPAHREICRLAHGEPQRDDLEAAHSCGKGHLGCVNQRHLRWATHSENQRDRLIHGTSSRGSGNGCATLTESDVIAVRQMLRDGLGQTEIGRRFNVTASTIHLIKTGRNWGWLKEAS